MTTNCISNLKMNRRRFIRICAAATSLPVIGPGIAGAFPSVYRWRGVALGARAEVYLRHENRESANQMFQKLEHEINRLEDIFSLYRANSEISKLNSKGMLLNPSLNFIELLETARGIFVATDGAFDPTVQSLWKHYAEFVMNSNGHSSGFNSEAEKIVENQTGFNQVFSRSDQIWFEKPGMAITLNGIAQGFVTDKIMELFKSSGYSNVLVDIGEMSASGKKQAASRMSDNGWPVTVIPDPQLPDHKFNIVLSDVAIASSAQFGTTFDQEGTLSHILDSKTGKTVDSDLIAASVIAKKAAIADGLSTSALVCGEAGLRIAMENYRDSSAFVVRKNGKSAWINAT